MRAWLENTEVRTDGTRREAHGVLATVGFSMFRIENAGSQFYPTPLADRRVCTLPPNHRQAASKRHQPLTFS